jgi:TrmH family RNA methyltransferase
VRWWPGLQTVICTQDVNIPLPQQVQKVTVPKDIMEYISPMQAPQGALFICRLPEQKPLEVRAGMLILDGIQDPGNLGTILRTADAMEVPVVLLEGCADPYSHKVVRSSMGAVFRSVPGQSTWQEVERACKEAGISVAVTALSPKAKDIRQAELSQMAVVIGSEGQGVRKEIMAAAQAELIIPMNEKCESLNAAVAATIVLWEMKK